MLCTFIVIASLDCLPDPPATNPHRSEVKAFRLHSHAESGKEQCNSPWTHVLVRWFAFMQRLESNFPVLAETLLSRASDPSPPLTLLAFKGR
jgi:hypothetical protein